MPVPVFAAGAAAVWAVIAATNVPIPVTRVVTSCGVIEVLGVPVLVPGPAGDAGIVDGAGNAVVPMSSKRFGLKVTVGLERKNNWSMSRKIPRSVRLLFRAYRSAFSNSLVLLQYEFIVLYLEVMGMAITYCLIRPLSVVAKAIGVINSMILFLKSGIALFFNLALVASWKRKPMSSISLA